MEWLIAAAVVTGLVSGVSSMYNRDVQTSEKKKELENQSSQLQTKLDDLKASYNLQTGNLKAEKNEKDNEYAIQISQAEETRDRALKNNSVAAGNNDQLANAQIATLQVDAQKSTAEAVQQSAVSGFRGTGSEMNAVKETERAGNEAIAAAINQRNANRFSNYASARESFTSANNQIAMYQRQRENSKASYDRTLAEIDLEYKQNNTYYKTQKEKADEDRAYMSWDNPEYATGQILGYASDLLTGGKAGIDTYNSGKSLLG